MTSSRVIARVINRVGGMGLVVAVLVYWLVELLLEALRIAGYAGLSPVHHFLITRTPGSIKVKDVAIAELYFLGRGHHHLEIDGARPYRGRR